MTWPFVTWMSRSPSLSTSKSFVPKPSGMKPDPRPDLRETSSNSPVAAVLVERVQLFGEVGDEDVREAVAVDVGAVDAHAGLRLAVDVEADAGAVGDVGERAVAVVAVEEVADHVVGDVDVGVAVAIEVAERDAEALAGGIGDAGLLRDVGERAVAVVADTADPPCRRTSSDGSTSGSRPCAARSTDCRSSRKSR